MAATGAEAADRSLLEGAVFAKTWGKFTTRLVILLMIQKSGGLTGNSPVEVGSENPIIYMALAPFQVVTSRRISSKPSTGTTLSKQRVSWLKIPSSKVRETGQKKPFNLFNLFMSLEPQR